MSKVIAVCNEKGGVAKSHVTANLGIGLARKGYRVFLIDADAQGSLGISLGIAEPDELDVTLATIMEHIVNEEDFELSKGIIKSEEGVDILPANIELSGIELSLVNIMSRELILREYITKVREQYDFIIIDCAPSLGMITINALASADSVLIPTQASYLPIKGLTQLIRTIGKVKRQLNSNLVIDGILFTMVNEHTNYAKDIIEMIHENYGGNIRIFKQKIPFSTRAAECTAVGVSIFKYDPKGKVAEAYGKLVEEVLANE